MSSKRSSKKQQAKTATKTATEAVVLDYEDVESPPHKFKPTESSDEEVTVHRSSKKHDSPKGSSSDSEDELPSFRHTPPRSTPPRTTPPGKAISTRSPPGGSPRSVLASTKDYAKAVGGGMDVPSFDSSLKSPLTSKATVGSSYGPSFDPSLKSPFTSKATAGGSSDVTKSPKAAGGDQLLKDAFNAAIGGPDVLSSMGTDEFEKLLHTVTKSSALTNVTLRKLLFESPYTHNVITMGIILTGAMAFGMGMFLRTGEHKELGFNELLASQKCFIQYIYESTVAPPWAPKGTYIIVGNKELIAAESRSNAISRRGHLDELAIHIDGAIRALPSSRLTIKHYQTGVPEKKTLHYARGDPVTLSQTEFTFLMTLGAVNETTA